MNSRTVVAFFAVVFAALTVSEQGRVNVMDITTNQVFNIAVLRNNQRHVFVYFTKKSCGICTHVVKNRLAVRARENTKTMDLAIVDFEKYPALQEAFPEVTTIPTTRVYYKGDFLDEITGPAVPAINKFIDAYINPPE